MAVPAVASCPCPRQPCPALPCWPQNGPCGAGRAGRAGAALPREGPRVHRECPGAAGRGLGVAGRGGRVTGGSQPSMGPSGSHGCGSPTPRAYRGQSCCGRVCPADIGVPGLDPPEPVPRPLCRLQQSQLWPHRAERAESAVVVSEPGQPHARLLALSLSPDQQDPTEPLNLGHGWVCSSAQGWG